MKKLFITAFLSLSVFLTGCATVISGTSQTLTFTSDIEDVNVYVDGALIGKTPVSASFKKNKVQSVMFQKDGYLSVTREVTKAYDKTALLSLFWDYSTTDLISGAAFEYEPNAIYVEMPPKE